MNLKITNNYQQQNIKNKNKLSNLEQEQNHRHGDHLEGYQLGGGRRSTGKKVQGLRSIIGKQKIHGGMLRLV